VITGGWKSPEVKHALDLCLACKGCKGECPVNVDMATYKAEFLSHYYDGRLRPRHAYAFGLIGRWARLTEPVARLANLFTQTPVLSRLAKGAMGVAAQRRLPAFAHESFRKWFGRRPRRAGRKPDVLLWPDTFNNYFHPETARAAVAVLERLGLSVGIPPRPLCCGRPLYDYGMLDTAKAWLRDILEVLRPVIEDGTPIVGLEPSCVAVFRDELVNLFPDDPLARQLSERVVLLSDFLASRVEDGAWPSLRRRAIVHGHCHQKALMSMTGNMKVLDRLGVDATLLDSGCCGMAGAFGFEAAHYEVSVACGERVLLPAVRAADEDTLIVADGFSCREQIGQTTGRRALHLAEVVDLAHGVNVPGDA
jgi:Fe-S oxidoreductase